MEAIELFCKEKLDIFLKDKQKEVLNNLVVKQWNALAILPTGSLLYQAPVAASVFTGQTIVVAPLIALMEDQLKVFSTFIDPSHSLEYFN